MGRPGCCTALLEGDGQGGGSEGLALSTRRESQQEWLVTHSGAVVAEGLSRTKLSRGVLFALGG